MRFTIMGGGARDRSDCPPPPTGPHCRAGYAFRSFDRTNTRLTCSIRCANLFLRLGTPPPQLFDMEGYTMGYVVGYIDADWSWVVWSYADSPETAERIRQTQIAKDLALGSRPKRWWRVEKRTKAGMTDWLVKERNTLTP